MTETRHDELEVLAAAYAIDALDGDERKQFESHLAGCAKCREQVAAYRSVTAGLGLGVEPVDPPASLKPRTIARATGKRPPVQAAAPLPAARLSFGWLGAAAGIVLTVALGLAAVYEWTAATTLSSAVTTAAAQAGQLRSELARTRGEARLLSNAVDVLTAPDVARFDLAATAKGAGATGRAFFSPSRGMLVRTDRLPLLQAGRAYQLWIVLPNAAPKGAGMFTVGRTGSGTLVAARGTDAAVPRNVVVTFAITNEPASGSPTPTTPILLAGNLKTE